MVLPALLAVQRSAGFVSADALVAVARHLRLTPNDVEGIASSYPDIRREAPAGVHVEVCAGLSCQLAGADELFESLERSTRGMAAEISRAPCLFSCATAPLAQVGTRVIGRATELGVQEAIADELRLRARSVLVMRSDG